MMKPALPAIIVLLAGCAGEMASTPEAPPAGVSGAPARFVYSPYKHVPIALDPNSRALSTSAGGTPTPMAAAGRSTLPPGVKALTLAFATGECGAESWEGLDLPDLQANLRALERAGIDYIISTGGEGGVFSCASDAGMESFIARYAGRGLIGLDFDLERDQSEALVVSLARRIAATKRKHPELRMSFTLATWAADDGTRAGLNALGERALRAIQDADVSDFYVNLMVMDYGEAKPGNCVVASGVCDMGRSAIQAARNLNARHHVPFDRIELTPMLGVNDVTANVFSLADAQVVSRFVREAGLGGLHFWSLDRDAPCPDGASEVSSTCSGLAGPPPFAFSATFRDGLR